MAYQLTADEREIIEALKRHEQELGLSQEQFAQRHLSYSATTWSRLKDGSYFEKIDGADKLFEALAADLRQIETSRLAEQRYGAREFFEHTDARLVLRAVGECRAKPLSDSNRLIVYLAPTGGGKSALCGRLRREGARIVEARESWQRSYFSCLRDIAAAISVPVRDEYSPDRLEESILRRLNSKRHVLVVDEGEFFGARTLNLLKLILNKSTAAVVLCAIPEPYDKWNRKDWHEAQQLRRRTHALVRLEPCTSATAKLFLKGISTEEGALTAAAAFARTFGGFNTLQELRDELEGQERVSREELVKAGNRIRARRGLEKILEK